MYTYLIFDVRFNLVETETFTAWIGKCDVQYPAQTEAYSDFQSHV